MYEKNVRPKMAFFGSSLVSAYWNGAATYYRGLLKAMYARGFDITFYEPDAYDRQLHRDIQEPDYARSVVYSATVEDARYALADAEGSDIVIKASGVGVLDEYLEQAVLDFQGPNTKVIFWDVDAPATLYGVQHNPDILFRRLIPEYDMILTYGGGDPVVNEYLSLGAQRCIPIYNALDPSTHYRVETQERFSASLSFLGNRMPDREERVWKFFFEAARLAPEHTFLLGGNGWDRNIPDLPNIHYLGHVYTGDHNAFNSSALAVLNINRESMARYGFSPPTRVFEAAGSAACLITDAWTGIELFLEPSRECLVAQDGAEVAQYLRNLNRAQAEEIGRAAQRRVLEEHTYGHRAAQLEALISESRHSSVKVAS